MFQTSRVEELTKSLRDKLAYETWLLRLSSVFLAAESGRIAEFATLVVSSKSKVPQGIIMTLEPVEYLEV